MYTNTPDQADEVALIRYSKQSNFRRDMIKGSTQSQRRKIVIFRFFFWTEQQRTVFFI